ncbi:unnamed protein product, partial [Amoebophrya sp. A25]
DGLQFAEASLPRGMILVVRLAKLLQLAASWYGTRMTRRRDLGNPDLDAILDEDPRGAEERAANLGEDDERGAVQELVEEGEESDEFDGMFPRWQRVLLGTIDGTIHDLGQRAASNFSMSWDQLADMAERMYENPLAPLANATATAASAATSAGRVTLQGGQQVLSRLRRCRCCCACCTVFVFSLYLFASLAAVGYQMNMAGRGAIDLAGGHPYHYGSGGGAVGRNHFGASYPVAGVVFPSIEDQMGIAVAGSSAFDAASVFDESLLSLHQGLYSESERVDPGSSISSTHRRRNSKISDTSRVLPRTDHGVPQTVAASWQLFQRGHEQGSADGVISPDYLSDTGVPPKYAEHGTPQPTYQHGKDVLSDLKDATITHNPERVVRSTSDFAASRGRRPSFNEDQWVWKRDPSDAPRVLHTLDGDFTVQGPFPSDYVFPRVGADESGGLSYHADAQPPDWHKHPNFRLPNRDSSGLNLVVEELREHIEKDRRNLQRTTSDIVQKEEEQQQRREKVGL